MLLVDTHTNTDRPHAYACPAMQINTGGHAQHSVQTTPAASSFSLLADKDEGPLVEICP